MTEYLVRELWDAETLLSDEACDFTVRYMSVAHVQTLAETHPEIITHRTVNLLKDMLAGYDLSHRTRSYFMCKQVASTLCSIVLCSRSLATVALEALKELLGITTGQPHRAVAETIGTLPISICGPTLLYRKKTSPPSVSLEDLIGKSEMGEPIGSDFTGRSLVLRFKGRRDILVIKLARSHESPDSLATEAMWMDFLGKNLKGFPVRFDIPSIVQMDGDYLFSVCGISGKAKRGLHHDGYAIAFTVDREYFVYPNEPIEGRLPPFDTFLEVISRNAFILARLASMGIVHTAPIPLFHNRVQRERRRDNGLYEWQRRGRLDRWLDSCRYPNIGFTGIRDMEHLASVNAKANKTYTFLGMHLFSLLLVAGSYFRNREPALRGLDRDGKPVDARHLFDKELLERTVLEVYSSYYSGFVGREPAGDFPVDVSNLADRMIEEMGVDRHMEEILRVQDQEEMSDREFASFLRNRGFSEDSISGFRKGKEEIVLHTGPHLGEFNHEISLPELIEAVETMACLCISGKFTGDQ